MFVRLSWVLTHMWLLSYGHNLNNLPLGCHYVLLCFGINLTLQTQQPDFAGSLQSKWIMLNRCKKYESTSLSSNGGSSEMCLDAATDTGGKKAEGVTPVSKPLCASLWDAKPRLWVETRCLVCIDLQPLYTKPRAEPLRLERFPLTLHWKSTCPALHREQCVVL